MKIRGLVENDIPSLSELYKHFWGEESSIPRMLETFQRIKNNPSYILLVADQDDVLVGSAMGIICEELYGECKPFMVIEDVIVSKDQRRSGVASSLMKELERIAVEKECNYILFVTESERIGAHKFYESLGYKLDSYKGFKKRL